MSNDQNAEPVNGTTGDVGTPGVSQPSAVTEAGYSETHTAENTPMKKVLPSLSEKIREGTEEDREKGYLPIFLGNSRVSHEAAQTLLSKWLQLTAIKDLNKEGHADSTMLASAKNEWDQYAQQHHPDQTHEQLEELCADLYRFMEEYVDPIKLRSKVMNEADISNVSDRGSSVVTSDVLGKKPSASTAGFSVSEIMRRSSLRAEQGDYQFDVLLRDSYCSLTFTRPSKLDLSALVNDINRTVKGYVRSVGGNNITLAYVAGMRVVWDFLASRIVSSSVSGLVDFKDLVRVIRASDFGTICMALIKSTHNNGIPLQLRCLEDKCNWNEFQIADPEKLVRVRRSIESPQDSAIYANVFNSKIKYSVEETLAMIKESTYGLGKEENRVYNADRTVYLEIGPPSLAEAFETFDYYAGKINPQLQEIRSKVIDQKEYETQVALLLTTLGGTEFLHWVKTYVSVAPPNSDAADTVFHRDECDAAEFNKGLMGVILESNALNKSLSSFILNKTPLMSHTFVGVSNYQCPECKKRMDSLQNPERKLGYTPIDPFMAFFILTQLKLMTQAAEAAEATKEAISE